MIPEVENVNKLEGQSFIVSTYSDAYFRRSWHYHPELELLLVTKGRGRRVVGDTTEEFNEGDFVLIGGNIPHAWFSDQSYFEESTLAKCESVFAQFVPEIFGTRFIQLPEMQRIGKLMIKAERGLKLSGDKHASLKKRFAGLPKMSSLEQLLALIQILNDFAEAGPEPIVSNQFQENRFISKSRRINRVHKYLMNNYMNDIVLSEVAKMVNMNTSSFCRFFKAQQGKTFTQYVKDVRIDFAQQLLVNTNLTSNQVGYECGYSSVSYFNQCFKSITGMSPLQYRENYKVI